MEEKGVVWEKLDEFGILHDFLNEAKNLLSNNHKYGNRKVKIY